MRLDDGMGYDTPQHPHRFSIRLSWPLITAAAVTVVAVIALVIAGLATIRGTVGSAPAPAPAATASPSAAATVPPSPPAGRRTASPASGGHDTGERSGAPTQVWGAFEAFMAAWGATDPEARQRGLAATATAQLAQGLAETRPENIVVAARTKVHVVGAGPYSAEFQVWFEDVASSVHVIVINDPGSPHGWRATRIESRGD